MKLLRRECVSAWNCFKILNMQHLLWWPLSVSFSLYISYSGTRPWPPGPRGRSFPLTVLSWERQAGGWHWAILVSKLSRGEGGGKGATCSKSWGCSTVSQWGRSSPSPPCSASLSPWLSSGRPRPLAALAALAMETMQDQETLRPGPVSDQEDRGGGERNQARQRRPAGLLCLARANLSLMQPAPSWNLPRDWPE